MQYIIRTLKVAFLFLLALVIGVGSYFFATYPGAYKTCTTIKFVDEPPSMQQRDDESFINIRNVIAKIPYQGNPEIVYVPKPELKYKQTIIDGRGNCSNMSFGLTYRLLQEGHDYQIVHLLSPDQFLKGVGHTVINMPYELDGEKRYGIVDLYNAGVPTSDGNPITLDQLRSGKLSQPGVLLLNPARVTQLSYYGSFLDSSALAVIENEEVASYYKFLDRVYFSLGSSKAEKYIFETASFVLGTYPNLYVANRDYDRLFAGSNKYIRYMALSLTWSMRIIMVLGPVLFFAGIWNRIGRIRTKRKVVARTERPQASMENRKHKEASEKQLVAVAD